MILPSFSRDFRQYLTESILLFPGSTMYFSFSTLKIELQTPRVLKLCGICFKLARICSLISLLVIFIVFIIFDLNDTVALVSTATIVFRYLFPVLL